MIFSLNFAPDLRSCSLVVDSFCECESRVSALFVHGDSSVPSFAGVSSATLQIKETFSVYFQLKL